MGLEWRVGLVGDAVFDGCADDEGPKIERQAKTQTEDQNREKKDYQICTFDRRYEYPVLVAASCRARLPTPIS